MVRVLIVDGSPVARALLREILDSDPDIEIVGEASTGLEGVEIAVTLGPDLITMNMVMADIDGLEAARRIMREQPVPVLFVAPDPHYYEINVVSVALHAGALDLSPGASRWGQEHGLVGKVKALAKARALKPDHPGALPKTSGSSTC